MNSSNLPKTLHIGLYVFAILIAGAGIVFVLTDKGTSAVHAQQDPFLERRINQIEQRFNLIETRISRVEQQSRFTDIVPQTSVNRDIEINLMRSQIQSLQLRIAELECNLLKLDERTLTAAAKQSRRKVNTNEIDRCRENPNTSVQLSARP